MFKETKSMKKKLFTFKETKWMAIQMYTQRKKNQKRR